MNVVPSGQFGKLLVFCDQFLREVKLLSVGSCIYPDLRKAGRDDILIGFFNETGVAGTLGTEDYSKIGIVSTFISVIADRLYGLRSRLIAIAYVSYEELHRLAF